METPEDIENRKEAGIVPVPFLQDAHLRNPVDIFGSERRPDFFCIGTEKAGTTWLWNCMHAHPHIGVPATKELRYFNAVRSPDFLHFRALRTLLENPRNAPLRPGFMERIATEMRLFYGGEPGYLRIFGQLDQPIVGELTPQYCLLPPERIARMRHLAPQARILYMLRDPVDRLVSGARMVLHVSDTPMTDETLLEAALHPMQIALCNAQIHLAKYEDTFGADRVGVFFYEDIRMRPAELLREICDFLGAEPAEVAPSVLHDVVNKGVSYSPGPDVIDTLHQRLAHVYEHLMTRFPHRVAQWQRRYRGGRDTPPE